MTVVHSGSRDWSALAWPCVFAYSPNNSNLNQISYTPGLTDTGPLLQFCGSTCVTLEPT